MSCSWTKYRWRSWHAQGLGWGPLGLDAGNLATLWHNRASRNGTLRMTQAERWSRGCVGASVAVARGVGWGLGQVYYVLCSNILWKSFKDCRSSFWKQVSYSVILERLLTPSHTGWLWWTGTNSRPAACQSAVGRRKKTTLSQETEVTHFFDPPPSTQI